MRPLGQSTREALEAEITNLEYDKQKIDHQIDAIRRLLQHYPLLPAPPSLSTEEEARKFLDSEREGSELHMREIKP